jgi:hypothetical protein
LSIQMGVSVMSRDLIHKVEPAMLPPIGSEYEVQHPVLRTNLETVTVFLHRVVGHALFYSHNLCCITEPMRARERKIVNVRHDPPDMFGGLVMRCDFEGPPPSPTYEELADTFVLITKPTPPDVIKANKQKAFDYREERIKNDG